MHCWQLLEWKKARVGGLGQGAVKLRFGLWWVGVGPSLGFVFENQDGNNQQRNAANCQELR